MSKNTNHTLASHIVLDTKSAGQVGNIKILGMDVTVESRRAEVVACAQK